MDKGYNRESNLEKRLPKLKPVNLGGYQFYINPSLGYYPYFSMALRDRVKRKKVNNIIFTGEAGSGKSYQSDNLFRVLSKRFDIEDIVFRYPEFLRCVLTSPRGTPIEFDEPSYEMGKRDWYKEAQKALVKCIESFRFKGKPLGIPVINKALLDKDVRDYMITYQVNLRDRGEATVYRVYPSPFKSKVYNYEFCKLKYGMFDSNLCSIESCLDCKKLMDVRKPCMIFRARYERKKLETQEERYEVALEEAEKVEQQHTSLDHVQAKALPHFDKFYDKDKDEININLLWVVLKRECKTKLGHNKLYRLKAQIEYDHPELFQEPKIKHEKQ